MDHDSHLVESLAIHSCDKKLNSLFIPDKCCELRVQRQFNTIQSEAYFINLASFLLAYSLVSFWVEIYCNGLIEFVSFFNAVASSTHNTIPDIRGNF
jgi:hypothetical protein